ncbi:MAG: hypothetical protein AAF632_20590 [Bacteroidota bacterium]
MIAVLAGFLTGSCNTAPPGKGSPVEGDCQARYVLNSGCHKQSSLNCTGNSPFAVGRATTESMMRQRNMRRKPLYLAYQPPIGKWNWRIMWTDSASLYIAGRRMSINHSVMGSPYSHHPEPPGVEHVI